VWAASRRDDTIFFFFVVFWIFNGRRAFTVLVSDSGVMRDMTLETCGVHVSFQLMGVSRMRLSYLVGPPPRPGPLLAPVQPST
jgi:hypothetical protein